MSNQTSVATEYKPTIGIECHVQLKTKSKLFSGADNDSRDAEPNSHTSPICFGLPGTLPVLNEQAVELAIRAGIALNAEIAPISSFDRKHYFYPDLPKGYQITQLERPIVGKGEIEVPMFDGSYFKVGITRAHLEEDAGKLTHPEGAAYSLVDLNRAGTPLIEIVSEPDMNSPEQAKAYAQELYLLMTYAGVTIGDLYHGNMRFDVNISVAPREASVWGTRVEIKNLNSFRSVERAAAYEFKRQVELLKKGEEVIQETRGWDDTKQRTFSQRSKENAHDYRYFPDADIPPVHVEAAHIEDIRHEVEPSLPSSIRARLVGRGLPAKDVATLFVHPFLLDRLLSTEGFTDDAQFKQVANLLINVLPGELERNTSVDLNAPGVLDEPKYLVKLADMVSGRSLSSTSAKEILISTWTKFKDPEETAKEKDLLQVSDTGEIEKVVDEVLAEPASQKAIDDIKAGNDKAIGYLVGQVMKRSKGKANPGMASELIRKRL